MTEMPGPIPPEREAASALLSLRSELVRLLGPRSANSKLTMNEWLIMRVGEVLGELDQAREELKGLHERLNIVEGIFKRSKGRPLNVVLRECISVLEG